MTPLPWHEAEKAILTEERWLSEVLDFGPFTEKDSVPIPPNLSSDKMLRQIAIAIVNGTIKAREIKSFNENGLWSESGSDIEQMSSGDERHGGHWHQVMMGIVKNHFTGQKFEVINEPPLNHGRADLGVYKTNYQDLYVEIGTTSLYKTWVNTQTMPNTVFLFIPKTTYAIELVTGDTLQETLT